MDAVKIGARVENEGAVVGFLKLWAGRKMGIEAVAVAAGEKLFGAGMKEEQAVGAGIRADEDALERFGTPLVLMMPPLFAFLFEISNGEKGEETAVIDLLAEGEFVGGDGAIFQVGGW